MRFDLLDEYGTLVPFGLGTSKRNRVLRNPDITCTGAKVDDESRTSKRMPIWAKLRVIFRWTGRREEYPVN